MYPAYHDYTFDLREATSWPGLKRGRVWMAGEGGNDLWYSPGSIGEAGYISSPCCSSCLGGARHRGDQQLVFSEVS